MINGWAHQCLNVTLATHGQATLSITQQLELKAMILSSGLY